MKKLSLVQAACLQATSAVLCAASFTTAQAQSAPQTRSADIPEIIVTASRSEQDLQTAPVGATIITRAQIESAGVVDANEAIRKIGGVAARSDLTGGRDYKLDLRGFGETADQNTVVLLDGLRISENEQAMARLSAISASTIERIEILRGGSSVVWGEGATSGVINVITRKDRDAGVHGSASALAESFGGVDGNVNLRIATGNGAKNSGFDINARSAASNSYRDNGRFRQDVASLGYSTQEGAFGARVRLETESAMNRFPAGLTYAQNLANPRQTTTPNDFGTTKQNRLSGGLDYKMGTWTGVLDVGLKNRTTESLFASFGSPLAVRQSDSAQISPKALYKGDIGGVALSSTLGIDVQKWNFHGSNVPDSTFTPVTRNAKQSNRAWFATTDWLFPTQTRVVAGYRSEQISKSAQDVGGANTSNALNNQLKATELSANQTLDKGLDIYARASKSYRLGVLEDYMVTSAGTPLRPQISNDKEIGIKSRQAGRSFTARYFLQNTVDEIYFDPMTFTNINFDPTKRSGVELQGTSDLGSAVTLSGSLQAMSAVFASGTYAGKHIPLVNERTATVRATYRIDNKQSVESAWRMLGSTFAGSDEAKNCGTKVPSSRMLDALYRWRDKGFEVSFGANNLTNQKTYQYDYGCGFGGYVYPEATRTLRAGIKYNF